MTKQHTTTLVWLGDESSGLVHLGFRYSDDRPPMDYTFRVDAALIPAWRRKFKYRPFEVLNAIQTHVKEEELWYAKSDGTCYDYKTKQYTHIC